MNGESREKYLEFYLDQRLPFREDLRALHELYPDAEERKAVHYAFAHRFVPDMLFASPFKFFLTADEGPTDATRFIQSFWWTFIRPMFEQKHPESTRRDVRIFRRISDVQAKWIEGVGRHALLVDMPAPEKSPHAFFAMAVSLIPRRKLPKTRTEPPTVRYLTLERRQKDGIACGLDEPGVLCERTAARVHLYHGIMVMPREADFIDAAKSLIGPPPPSSWLDRLRRFLGPPENLKAGGF